MPFATATTLALLGMGATAGTAVASSVVQKKSADKAADIAGKSNEEALAFERENEARRREEFDRVEDENKRRWAIEADREERWRSDDQATAWRDEVRDVQTYNAEQARRQPYRDMSLASLQDLGRRAGLSVTPTTATQLAAPSAPPAGPSMSELARYDAEKAKRV